MLARLEVNTVEDLVYFFPRFHEDRSRIGAIRDVVVGETATLRGKIRSCGVHTTKTGITLFQAKVGDASGVIHANWFHQPYLASQFKVGDEVVLSGRVVRYAQLTIANPDYDIVTGEDTTSLHMGRIVPIYRLTRDLSQRPCVPSCIRRLSATGAGCRTR